jgi:serine/threonine protein kinase
MLERQQELQLVGETLQSGRLAVVAELGKGTFGAVYRVADKRGRTFACKVLFPLIEGELCEPGQTRRRSLDRLFHAEARAHAAATGHSRVLRLHEHFVERDLCCFLFDLCIGGTLFDFTATPNFWRNDAEIKRVFLQVITAVRHCHKRGVAHRDLKPENILADSTGTNFYLADFGLATMERKARAVGAGSILYTAPGTSTLLLMLYSLNLRRFSFLSIQRSSLTCDNRIIPA